jgi:glycosyltransferase involved in cell wall biosynthesis
MIKMSILYIESPSARYGSSLSLKYLIENIDRDKYIPYVLVNAKNEIGSELEDLGAIVYRAKFSEVASLTSRGASGFPVRSAEQWYSKPLQVALRVLRIVKDRMIYRNEIKKIKSICRTHNIDLIHSNNQFSTNRMVYLANIKNVSYVQHVRDAGAHVSSALYPFVPKDVHVIAPSKVVESQIRKSFNSRNITVIPNPVPEIFYEGTKSSHKSPQKVVFCQLGRVIPLKGQDALVLAFSQVLKKTRRRYPVGVQNSWFIC